MNASEKQSMSLARKIAAGFVWFGLFACVSTQLQAEEKLTPWDVELFDAIYENDVKKIQKILKSGVDVYATNATGKNAMEFARFMARHKIADVLELYAKNIQSRVSSIDVKFKGAGKKKIDAGEYRVFDEDALQRELDKLNYGMAGSALAEIQDSPQGVAISNEQLELEMREITGGIFGFASTTEYVEVASKKLAEETSYNPFAGFLRALTGSRDNQVLVVKKTPQKKPTPEKAEEKKETPKPIQTVKKEEKKTSNPLIDWLTPKKKKNDRQMRVEVVTVEEKDPDVKVSIALDKLKEKEKEKKKEVPLVQPEVLVDALDLENEEGSQLGDAPIDEKECITRQRRTYCVHQISWSDKWAEVFKLKTSLPFADSRVLVRYENKKAQSFHVFFESRHYRIIKEFYIQQLKKPSSVWQRTRRVLTKGIVPYEVTAWRTADGQTLEIQESSDYRAVGLRDGHGAIRLLNVEDRTKPLKSLRQADLMIMATKRLRSGG